MNKHISGEDLAAYADGALKDEAKARVEAHLSRCRECLEALADITEMQSSRVKIPGEFLSRALKVPVEGALKVPAEGILERDPAPARKVMPLRLAYGVAAVFLVAVVAGYFFLGRGRSWQAMSAQKERSDLAMDKAAAREPAEPGEPGPASAVQAVPAATAKAKKKFAAKEIESEDASVVLPVKPAAAADEAAEKEIVHAAEGEVEKLEESVGIVGGIPAPQEKDKAGEIKLASSGSAAPAYRLEEIQKYEKSVPVRGTVMNEMRRSRSLTAGTDAAAGAMQIFLALSGRAAAPRKLPSAFFPSPTAMRIEGDAAPGDLLDPEVLDAWDWFPEGKALELTIAADGSVTAVTLLGQWDAPQAARATEAAGKLIFRESALETRQVLMSRGIFN